MPPRIPRIPIGLPRSSIAPSYQFVPRFGKKAVARQQICLFCSIQADSLPPQTRKQTKKGRRHQSTDSSIPPSSITAAEARKELKDALFVLQKKAGSYLNVSRLNLALRGIAQTPGHESIRVAILALADGGHSLRKAKRLARAIIADPLNEQEEEWERALMSDTAGDRPILLRIDKHEQNEVIQRNVLLQEFHVSTSTLKSDGLEIMILEIVPPLRSESGEENSLENALLVPTMVTPTSSSGRYIPITLPVHKSVALANGIMGAATLISYGPDALDRDVVFTAADLPKAVFPLDSDSSKPFHVVDIAKGDEGVQAFRRSVENALDYETAWYGSGVVDVKEWIEAGTSTQDGEMKPSVRSLIASILQNARSAIETENSRLLSDALAAKFSNSGSRALQEGLSTWSEKSHRELRDDLDVAFNGKRWRKLGWWKLFWRVDDVSMIASDILNQRFLTDAERQVIFLSGRFQEAGAFKGLEPSTDNNNWAYRPVVPEAASGPPPPRYRDLVDRPEDIVPTKSENKPWPLDIPAARSFLSVGSVPALQALAQKLVFQTLSTSALTSVLAGLIYVSTLSTTLYEAGAVAAIGIVWSLKRMQGKWETARTFWEGEVREEGRKAVKQTEAALGATLIPREQQLDGVDDVLAARKAVEKAEAALEACR